MQFRSNQPSVGSEPNRGLHEHFVRNDENHVLIALPQFCQSRLHSREELLKRFCAGTIDIFRRSILPLDVINKGRLCPSPNPSPLSEIHPESLGVNENEPFFDFVRSHGSSLALP